MTTSVPSGKTGNPLAQAQSQLRSYGCRITSLTLASLSQILLKRPSYVDLRTVSQVIPSIFAHSSWLALFYYSLPNAVVAGTMLPMPVLKTLSTQINGTVAVGNERELFRSTLWSNYTPERGRAWAGHWYQGDNWSELSGCGTARYAPAQDQQACFKIKFYDATYERSNTSHIFFILLLFPFLFCLFYSFSFLYMWDLSSS